MEGEDPVGKKLDDVDSNEEGKLLHVDDPVGKAGELPEMNGP